MSIASISLYIFRLASLRPSFWCWSRKDYDENYLKKLNISIAYKEETFNSFSTTFTYNGSHVKCDSEEEWAQTWFDLSNYLIPVPPIPCVTNTSSIPVASFQWGGYPHGKL